MRKLTIVVVALLTTLLAASPALAVDEVNTKRLRNAVTVGGILAHERVFQRIANQNGGTRASGTPGYDASAAYVAGRLEAAGYQVSLQEFTFPFFEDLGTTLTQESPDPTAYETGAFTYSPDADVTGTLVPIDLVIPATPAPSSTSGCELSDFPTPPPADPAIALIQRGTCTFQQKAENAQAAGYDAAIIFNEGNPGRTDLFIGTLGVPLGFPVVGLSYADAVALYEQLQAGQTVVMRIVSDTEIDLERETVNVIADSPTGNADRVVVVGAHLDSVPAGPGINDNGSGSSTILEIAEEMAELGIRNRQQVRFAFWGAEELNLLGSQFYVDTLSDDDLGKIFANLNFDMLGSTNYVRFVYDGDGSPTGTAGPPGSAQIEAVFNQLLRQPGPGQRADAVQRPLRLRPLHRGRHPRRRPVQRRRGHQDAGAGRHLRRHRRRPLRPVLPPALRHHQQPQHQGPVRDGRRRRPRHHDPRPDPHRLLRGRQLPDRRAGRRRRQAPDLQRPAGRLTHRARPDRAGPSAQATRPGRDELHRPSRA